jgi:hypothetical protein
MKRPTTLSQCSLTSLLLLLAAAIASGATISLDPRATYLRTEGDTALDAVAYPLSSFGIVPGDYIQIERQGFYTPLSSGYPDSNRYLDAVFSGSAVLLSYDNPNRVQDAVAAGTGVITPNTWIGNLPTDIPQDFVIDDGSTFSSVELQVPAGARYIFFTVNDSLFGDNGDPNGDFGALITVIPEPSTSALVVSGVLLGLSRRYCAKTTIIPKR